MNRWSTFAVITAGLCLSTGCASTVNMQRASTLGRGNFEGGIEPGVWGAAGSNGTGGAAAAAIPHIDFAFRYGVGERFDLGVRLGSSFVEAQFKGMFTDPDSNFVVSLAPQIGGIFVGATTGADGSTGGGGILNLGVPVMFGFKWGAGHEFVLAPRLQNFLVFGGGSTGYILAVGGSVGNAFQLSENFALMPELGVVAPVFASAQQSGGSFASTGLNSSVIYTFKLGLLIGRTRNGQSMNRRPMQDMTPPPPPPPSPNGV